MLILGLSSLYKDLFKPATSFYIEHVLSNLMIPVNIYGVYVIFEAADFD